MVGCGTGGGAPGGRGAAVGAMGDTGRDCVADGDGPAWPALGLGAAVTDDAPAADAAAGGGEADGAAMLGLGAVLTDEAAGIFAVADGCGALAGTTSVVPHCTQNFAPGCVS